MDTKKITAIVLFTLFLTACSTDNALEPTNKNNNVELTKISTNQIVNQEVANDVKELLSKYKQITKIKAINTTNELLVAIEVKHESRLQLSEIRKKLKKEIEKHFSGYHVEFSTDKKIVLELEKIEEQIAKDSLTTKEFKKKFKDLIELSKKQT